MENVLNKLMARQTAAERLFEALALTLDAGKILPLAALLPVLRLMQSNACFTEDETTADCMAFVIDRLHAHATARSSGESPLQTLLLETESFARTPFEQRQALATFLGFATPEEISDEFSASLRRPRAEIPGAGRHPGGDLDGQELKGV